eukprot:jgi/Botrbrau1/19057/Bobra.0100s0081.1
MSQPIYIVSSADLPHDLLKEMCLSPGVVQTDVLIWNRRFPSNDIHFISQFCPKTLSCHVFLHGLNALSILFVDRRRWKIWAN